MAVATLNQNYHYASQNNWSYPDDWTYNNLNQNQRLMKQEEELSSLLRDSMTTDSLLLSGYNTYELDQTDVELDPAIQELILQSEPSNTMVNFEIPDDFMIKQEYEDSDNESVMCEFDNLNFLDHDRSLDSDDSCFSGNNSPKLRTNSRSSVDSGYEDNNIPRFDCIYNENKLTIATEGFYEDDDMDSKPYCKSNRGAKKNLLWKFILETLNDKKQKLISWQNEEEGTFKFDDTVAFSKRWGARKGKNDMNFEKLSRAIRHYYKNGLMSRISTERLVYKFNWKSVPLRYRKY